MVLTISLVFAPGSSGALLLGAALALVAWAAAIPLNSFEHKYEVRSSNYLFVYYTVTLGINLFILFMLAEDNEQSNTHYSPFKLMSYFTVSIAIAFFFEAFPRKNTRVQQFAREKENLSDWQLANLFSRLTFHYFQHIVTLGAERSLTGNDIANIAPDWVKTDVNFQLVSRYWEQSKKESAAKNKEPSFLWTVMRAYKHKIAMIMVIRLLGYVMQYMSPILFGQLLQFIGDYSKAVKAGEEPPSMKIGFMITGAMLFFNITCQFALSNGLQKMTELGSQARAATIALVYRKALRLSPQARQSSTLGEITNHMSVDAEKWIDAWTFLPFTITAPFELLVSIFLLYRLLGWSLFAGLAVFGILVPIQAKSAVLLNSSQDEQLEWMDKRVRLMTELLSNIKIVKLYHWETPFRKKIDFIRTNELRALKVLATIRSILTIVFSSVTLLMALFAFATFAYYGGPNMTPGKLTSEIIFVSITLFGIMNRPLGMITHAFSTTVAVNIAMKRIRNFLLMEEIGSDVVRRYSRQPKSEAHGKANKEPVAVDITNGTFTWEKPVDTLAKHKDVVVDGERQPLLAAATPQPVKPTLSDINLRIPEGNLIAIVGRVGQGKSSLLSSIMGEMYKNPKSTVTVYGDLAYVPQQAWIINATVRDNILFGKPFDQAKYDHIIYASGLQPDLAMLVAGDQTEIGERGINLSGGQKQRVSLARAAYQDADIYLLDDPLSAVDAHVDQHLWEHLIGPDGLLKDKTRILVTHGIHHLEHVDQIVVIKDGLISEEGEYEKLIKARGAFYQLIKEFSVNKKHSSPKRRLHGKKNHGDQGEATNSTKNNGSSDGDDGSERDTIVGESDEKVTKDSQNGNNNGSGGLVAEEKMEAGRVGWNVVMIYARAVSYPYAITCISLFVLAQACQMSTNFWLRYWISDMDSREGHGSEPRPTSYYLIGYGILVVLFMALDVVVNYTAEVICGLRASKVIYNRLLTRILHMPMSFFDTTPMGRIVNRFSSDIDSIDTRLPEEWNDLFSFISIIGGTLLVIAYSTPTFLISIPPLFLTYFWIQNYFILSSSSLRRLNSTTKSPLYQHFSETLAGVSSIRVMKGLREQFIKQNDVRADAITNCFHASNLDNRWLQIRLEALGGVTVFVASSLAVWNAATLDPSLVGLALSYALNLTGFITFLVRTVNAIQNVLISVERVEEYSQKPVEAPVETGARLPPNWPSQGRIVFKNYSARYREGLDLVIKNISFTVEPTESVGIVGRTGAGKSSLTLALFRIIEVADSYWARASDPTYSQDHLSNNPLALYSDGQGNGGSIEIDGVDISTLGLKDLRQHLAIIPQDPTLFAGTIRTNLDPFEEHTDNDLWEALERAHLKAHIAALEGGLSFEVSQNGENFSVGQRSLICLARALLRKTKVLVLDEATAAVDVETDDLIQKTIRKEFKDRTILTIAHRIKTVMDSDKILVLENGHVQEYAPPKELLKNKSSLFYKLADQAGEVN
ncbi:hypothetical protein BGZ46_007309 [Entomortierella lignicola]|nr:hypothetical protein BGZ46_007309 [Entomortierella lignicola]